MPQAGPRLPTLIAAAILLTAHAHRKVVNELLNEKVLP